MKQNRLLGGIKMENKYQLELFLEFLKNPISLSDIETGELFTDIPVIDHDETVKRLNREIGQLYSSYFEFDSHNQPCYFNKVQEKKDKDKMLSLFTQLVQRLDEINDGSYVVVDLETNRIKAL